MEYTPPIPPPQPVEPETEEAAAATPSPSAQSWGAFLSIVIIMLMVIVGAFYAWGNRIARQREAQEAMGGATLPVESSTQPPP